MSKACSIISFRLFYPGRRACRIICGITGMHMLKRSALLEFHLGAPSHRNEQEKLPKPFQNLVPSSTSMKIVHNRDKF